jgi:hypothetical protein
MLIIGNGPSLRETPLDDFKQVKAIGMNKINLLFPQVAWRPSLIVCANNLVAKQNAEYYGNAEIPVFCSWKNRWFLPAQARRNVKFFLNLPNRDFSTDLTMGLGSAGTVTYTALQFAHYMGADPVVIFGVDHNFTYEGKPNEIRTVKEEDKNHFVPNYFAKGQKWGVPNLEVSEEGYRNARKVFEAAGRRVVDATIGGKLRVFDRVDVVEAKRLCGLA